MSAAPATFRDAADGRVPILYLAPWVDYGGADSGTIEWFRWLDRGRFRGSLITTQPSPNRRLTEVWPHAEEVWCLPDLMAGEHFPGFIVDFIHSRGVQLLHIMNSRLGFELLPDIRCLPNPPAVVVQLHAEEADASGYVRYVSTRYGNLVDAFSLVSGDLVRAVQDYGVPPDRCALIRLGVDTEGAFSPNGRLASPPAADDAFQILFPARLADQKDPLLMVRVAAALRDSGTRFQIHAVGEGPMEPVVRASVAEEALGGHVVVHPPTRDMRGWYERVQAVLLTSLYEGAPCTIYEAMSMAVPVVVPALPGNAELVGAEAGHLISPRDDVSAYVAALQSLIAHPEERARMGRAARRRACDRFSVSEMALGHARLYDQLLARRPRNGASNSGEPEAQSARSEPQIVCAPRDVAVSPLVSVIIPCYQHGQFLPECLASVRKQTYPATEIIVVDDASEDATTQGVLRRLDHDADVQVVRQAINRGPGAARNAGIERARGRYVLPVDADNLLVPDAVERMVDQLQQADPAVGFIYPNLEYFGNRDHKTIAPDYNLCNLLEENFVDTCSLIDRSVFVAGLRFSEDAGLTHEDWEFALAMAERGVCGQPANGTTVLMRKWGFTRSDLVDLSKHVVRERIRQLHSNLYGDLADIKRRYCPALSIVVSSALSPPEVAALRRDVVQQTCLDAEVSVPVDAERPGSDETGVIRTVMLGSQSPAEIAARGLSAARGRYLMVIDGTGAGFFADRGFIEKVLRTFVTNPELGAIGFRDDGAQDTVPYQRIDGPEGGQPAVAAVWRAELGRGVGGITIEDDAVAGTILRVLATVTQVQWRRGVDPGTGTAPRPSRLVSVDLGGAAAASPSQEVECAFRLRKPALLPSRPEESLPRWRHVTSWTPPISTPLMRHWNPRDGRRTVSTDPSPPPGFIKEYELGSIYQFRLMGTRRLVAHSDGTFTVNGPGDTRDGETTLGYLDEVGLPLLDQLVLGRHRHTGELVLVAGADDPVAGEVEAITVLGSIEPFPLRPRAAPRFEPCVNAVSALTERDAELARERVRADALQARLDRIVGSFPARVYRQITRVPGVRRLLVKPPGR